MFTIFKKMSRVLALLLVITAYLPINVKASSMNFDFDFDTIVSVPDYLRAPVSQAVISQSSRFPSGTLFYSTAFRFTEDGDMARAVLVPAYVIESGWETVQGEDIIEIWLQHQSAGVWAVQSDVHTSLAAQSQSFSSLEYRFPWTSGQTWWKNQGFHSGGWGLSNLAVDFQPQSSNHAVLAAATGTLDTVCGPDDNGQTWLIINHPDGGRTGYGHIDANTIPTNLIGKSVSRGQYLGDLYSTGGAYSTYCGYGTVAHLHFVFPNQSITMYDGLSGSNVSASEIGAPGESGSSQYKSNNTLVDDPAPASFSKLEPYPNGGSIDLPSDSLYLLQWESNSVDWFEYCIDEINNNQCDSTWHPRKQYSGDNEFTLVAGHTYYWQVRRQDNHLEANDGQWWSFTVKLPVVRISGNAGISGATLSYTGGTSPTTADSNGNYSFTVSPGWTGTVTPSMDGYSFDPINKSYNNLTTDQTAQNYTALVTISGNAGIGGATLNYGGSTPVTADPNGNYSITVPYNWGGIVTPSKSGYSFDPINKTYTNVLANQTLQNYTALVTISGNAGVGGATLTYLYGSIKTVQTQADGSYSFTVPYNWTGTVTPSHRCYYFGPENRSYSYITTNQTSQSYTATLKPEGCVLSITRANPDVTSATTVDFTVTFSHNVTGVFSNDFALTTLALNNTSISTVSGSGTTYTVTVNTGTSNGSIRLDIPSNATITNMSTNQQIGGLPFTSSQVYTIMKTTARVAPADFNGDGKADIAIFRPSDGTWRISGSQGPLSFGQLGDIPVPVDYDGDGDDDIAVFRPNNGINNVSTWHINGIGMFPYGQTGDIPVPADYDGDGDDDIAVFRPSNNTWYVSGIGQYVYGLDGDIPVPADYNGDGKDDIAVFRSSNNTWYLYGVGPTVYGTAGDIPAVADYNGDGKSDIAVFRPSNNTWYLYGVGPTVYGTAGDIPVAANYTGDNKAEIAVFRPSNGTWYLSGTGPTVFGVLGDIPV